METGERHHVDGQLSQISVKLTWETQARGDTAHDGRHKVVQVTIGGGGQLQSAEANIVQGLVVNAEGLVRVFHKLVHRQSGVVWFNDRVGHLGGWHNRECAHHSVWVLFTDLGDQQCSCRQN